MVATYEEGQFHYQTIICGTYFQAVLRKKEFSNSIGLMVRPEEFLPGQSHISFSCATHSEFGVQYGLISVQWDVVLKILFF